MGRRLRELAPLSFKFPQAVAAVTPVALLRQSRLFQMKHPSRFFRLAPFAVGVVVLVAGGGMGATPAFARKKNNANQLQIWPGQRVLIVLPLKVNPNFLDPEDSASAPATTPAPVSPPADKTAPVSAPADGALTAAPVAGATTGATASSGSGELALALVPLVSGQLSSALQSTGKFSITLPYLFDPLLRRALQEEKISDDDVKAFVLSPTLPAAQSVLSQLNLDQPGMVAQVALENLLVGGTQQSPTVQVRMRGDIYQTGQAQPFRSITVTSKPYGGSTPEDRLKAASGAAFNDIAAAFVEPPDEFQLPIPVGSSAGANGTGRVGGSGSNTGGGVMRPGAGGTTVPLAPPVPLTPAVPGGAPISTPNPGVPTLNAPVAPVLPPATPPLGLNVPAQGN